MQPWACAEGGAAGGRAFAPSSLVSHRLEDVPGQGSHRAVGRRAVRGPRAEALRCLRGKVPRPARGLGASCLLELPPRSILSGRSEAPRLCGEDPSEPAVPAPRSEARLPAATQHRTPRPGALTPTCERLRQQPPEPGRGPAGACPATPCSCARRQRRQTRPERGPSGPSSGASGFSFLQARLSKAELRRDPEERTDTPNLCLNSWCAGGTNQPARSRYTGLGLRPHGRAAVGQGTRGPKRAAAVGPAPCRLQVAAGGTLPAVSQGSPRRPGDGRAGRMDTAGPHGTDPSPVGIRRPPPAPRPCEQGLPRSQHRPRAAPLPAQGPGPWGRAGRAGHSPYPAGAEQKGEGPCALTARGRGEG